MFVFITTFVSPHTLPLGLEMTKYYDRVVFINTMELTEERKRMGYDIKDERIEIFNLYKCEEKCRELIEEAGDVILAGTRFDLVDSRIRQGKQVFIAHERIFKKGAVKWLDPRTWQLIRFCRAVRNERVYFLSIGDFAARDLKMLGFNKDKIFRFGYFPKNEVYSEEKLHRGDKDKCRVLWVGRMVDFKRPLMALKAFRRLPDEFSLTMVGDGALMPDVRKYIERKKLKVEILGNVSNETVREMMSSSDLLLSTSDKGEGWGAVINEGMGCGCAVVCSDSMGCAGTLANKDNAVLFRSDSLKDLVRAIEVAAKKREYFSKKALKTVKYEYNPSVAAERFVRLAALDDKVGESDGGVCSKVF